MSNPYGYILVSRGDLSYWEVATNALTGALSVVNAQSFGASPVVGTSSIYARQDHTHGTPTNPVTGHESTYNHALLHSNYLDHSNALDHSNTLDHSNANDPTSDQKGALGGYGGTPSATNKYVTANATEMTNQRTPTTHDDTYHTNGMLVPKSTGARYILYGNGTEGWSQLAPGSNGQYLHLNAQTGDLEWVTHT